MSARIPLLYSASFPVEPDEDHAVPVPPVVAPKKPMITELSLITAKWKIYGLLAVATGIFAVDMGTAPQSIEDYTLKSALAVAVIFLTRLLLQTLKEHKTEMKELRDKHEQDMKTVVAANTASNDKVAALTATQTAYFEKVTQKVLDEKFHMKP